MARTEQLDSPRILAGAAGSLEVTVYQDGVPADPAVSPVPTCTVVDGAGAAVASGTATIVGSTSGRLTFALSAAQNASPNLYVASWSFTVGGVATELVTRHESVGQLLFTLAEARAYEGSTLASGTAYPSDVILRGRDLILDAFEQITGVAFGTRYARRVFDGPGGPSLELPAMYVQRVRSVEERSGSSWTTYGSEQLDAILVYPDGTLYQEAGAFGAGRRNVAIEYEYGRDPIPEEIRQAALRLLRNQLVKSNLPDRATSQTNELGSFALAVAGRPGQWFGIPLVDSVLTRLRERPPTVR